jgi:hypothetical protein
LNCTKVLVFVVCIHLNKTANIIKDCFGVERLDEYIGKGALDVVIVYGCEPDALTQAPGGRDNAKMVSKSTFKEFSLEHNNGNYFLRPDRIMGAFHYHSNAEASKRLKSKSNWISKSKSSTSSSSSFSLKLSAEMLVEMKRDKQSVHKLEMAEAKLVSNVTRIDEAVDSVWKRGEASEIVPDVTQNSDFTPPSEDGSDENNKEEETNDRYGGGTRSTSMLKRLSWLHRTPTSAATATGRTAEQVIEMSSFGGGSQSLESSVDVYHQNPLSVNSSPSYSSSIGKHMNFRGDGDSEEDSNITEI